MPSTLPHKKQSLVPVIIILKKIQSIDRFVLNRELLIIVRVQSDDTTEVINFNQFLKVMTLDVKFVMSLQSLT